jgi:hypothetical protein
MRKIVCKRLHCLLQHTKDIHDISAACQPYKDPHREDNGGRLLGKCCVTGGFFLLSVLSIPTSQSWLLDLALPKTATDPSRIEMKSYRSLCAVIRALPLLVAFSAWPPLSTPDLRTASASLFLR